MGLLLKNSNIFFYPNEINYRIKNHSPTISQSTSPFSPPRKPTYLPPPSHDRFVVITFLKNNIPHLLREKTIKENIFNRFNAI